MRHRVLSLAFQIIKKILKSVTIRILYLSIICLNSGTQEKCLEGWKKNIKIYNIETQIMFQRLKKRNKVFKKMAYTKKPIKMNEIYCKRSLGGGGKVNVSI